MPVRVFENVEKLEIWLVYCLVLAPLFYDGSYGEIALDKSKSVGIGFTIGTFVVGAILYAIVKRNSQQKAA